jgi:PKD domain
MEARLRLTRSLPALLLAWFALGAGEAHADHFGFSVSPNPPNQGQVTTFALQGPAGDVERVRWDLDGDGEFDAAEEDRLTVTHVYGAPGPEPVTVRMRVDEEGRGRPHRATRAITINGAPTVGFGFNPAVPVTGQEVSFTPATGDPEDDDVALAWSFGDGGRSSERSPRHTYAARGTYAVTLRATDEHGATAFAGETVTVGQSRPLRLARMRPFPLVRIAGIVLPNGADVRILSVRALRGARVRVRCRGRGCPVRSLTRPRASGRVRLRRFERRLRAGTRLELFVTQPGRIGKYTRFRIRAGKPPARVDRCLMPGRARPIRCP